MISDAPSFEDLAAFGAEVGVIGGGPVGIVTALALARAGRRVLLLESGGRAPRPAAQALAAAESFSAATHHAPEIAVARRLGGASNLWGGRCLPFDPIDFRARPWLGLGGLADRRGATSRRRRPRPARRSPPARRSGTRRCRGSRPTTPSASRASSAGATCRGSSCCTGPSSRRGRTSSWRSGRPRPASSSTGGRVAAVELHLEGRGPGRVAVPEVVLAAGGNESTRLLLALQRRQPALFGGEDGPLGRFYMGHVNGQIADLALESPALDAGLDFFEDGHGSYVRRRLVPSEATQERERLSNVAFWPVVPPIADPAHRSGPLSAVFLALSVAPVGRRLVAEPIRLKHVGAAAVPARRAPREPPPRPRPDARLRALVPLEDQAGAAAAAGALPAQPRPALRARVPCRAAAAPREPADARQPGPTGSGCRGCGSTCASPTRTRRRWCGRTTRSTPGSAATGSAGSTGGCRAEARAAAVLAAAKHGNHQIGTIRMGADRRTAVVDGDCRSFDLPNLFVVSTAVLPTSGQANPTMTAVQLGLRLAARLAGQAAETKG